jgi:CBS domain-containing protein
MSDASAEQPPVHPTQSQATVADVMRKPLTTVEQNDHVAAAAYVMRHNHASALIVLDAQANQPIGIITEADITRTVADRKDMNEVRIHELMTARPTVIKPATSVFEAARIMTSARFRHLPVVDDGGLVGVVDVADVCRALVDPAFAQPPA